MTLFVLRSRIYLVGSSVLMKFSPSAKSLATTKNNKAVGPVDTTLAGTTGSDVFAATRAVTLPKTAKPTSTQTGVPFFGSPFESCKAEILILVILLKVIGGQISLEMAKTWERMVSTRQIRT